VNGDSELLNAIENREIELADLISNTGNQFMSGGWEWYDWTNNPDHHGWRKAESLRDALQQLLRTHGDRPQLF
jgi:hypothetical protein